MSKKLRADSLEGRLLAAGKKSAVEALERWLFDEGATLADCCSRLLSEFGDRASVGSMHAFYHHRKGQRSLNRLKSSNELAEMVNQLGRQNQLDDASLAVASQLTLDLATAEKPDVESLTALLKIVLKNRELGLARDRFEFDAATAALAKLPELHAVSEKKLSAEEKAEAVRKILFNR